MAMFGQAAEKNPQRKPLPARYWKVADPLSVDAGGTAEPHAKTERTTKNKMRILIFMAISF